MADDMVSTSGTLADSKPVLQPGSSRFETCATPMTLDSRNKKKVTSKRIDVAIVALAGHLTGTQYNSRQLDQLDTLVLGTEPKAVWTHWMGTEILKVHDSLWYEFQQDSVVFMQRFTERSQATQRREGPQLPPQKQQQQPPEPRWSKSVPPILSFPECPTPSLTSQAPEIGFMTTKSIPRGSFYVYGVSSLLCEVEQDDQHGQQPP